MYNFQQASIKAFSYKYKWSLTQKWIIKVSSKPDIYWEKFLLDFTLY
jgi:hypothetical protein